MGRTSGAWRRWLLSLPGARAIIGYERGWLGADVGAGLVLTALLVPQGMAYAELAGLPAVTGLYTTVLALAAYAVFGPSRILVLGPDSALAPLIAAAVVPLAAGDPAQAVSLAAALALLTGVVCVGTGVARLGTITELLSKPVRVGYINGIAVIVLVSQLPKLLGFSSDADGFVAEVAAVVSGVGTGRVDATAAFLGVGSLAIMVTARHLSPRIPGVLAATVAATLAVSAFDLAADGISVVGQLPAGLPTPTLPRIGFGDLMSLGVAAVGVAVVAFADTAALSTTFAAKLGDPVDPNKEIAALGAANVAAGLFQGFPMSASSSRTAVADAVGSKTQLTGVVGAVSIVGLLVFANALLADLPSATLAAIVIVASFALFDFHEMRWLWNVRRSEFLLSLGALLGVTFAGVLEGLGIAVGLSLGNFVRRAWRPHDAVLGRVEGLRGYHDIERHPEAEQIPGLVIFRFDAPMFFANAEHFQRRLAGVIRATGDVRWVVVAAEPVTDVDTTAADTLREILDEFEARDIQLAFAELKGPVKDRLRTYGLYDRVGDEHFYPTLGRATSAYVSATGVRWVDWTDR